MELLYPGGRWGIGLGGPLSVQLRELFSPPFSARLFCFYQGELPSNQEGSADLVRSFALNSGHGFFTGQSSEENGSFWLESLQIKL